MPSSRKPLSGPRRFQWNTGGWFGSSLGGTAWMLVIACILAFRGEPATALVPAVCFAVVFAISIVLWLLRDRVYPFAGLMILLGLLAVTMPLVWVVVGSSASPATLTAMNWPSSIWNALGVSSIAPLLILWFCFLEYSVTPAPDPDAKKSNPAG